MDLQFTSHALSECTFQFKAKKCVHWTDQFFYHVDFWLNFKACCATEVNSFKQVYFYSKISMERFETICGEGLTKKCILTDISINKSCSVLPDKPHSNTIHLLSSFYHLLQGLYSVEKHLCYNLSTDHIYCYYLLCNKIPLAARYS